MGLAVDDGAGREHARAHLRLKRGEVGVCDVRQGSLFPRNALRRSPARDMVAAAPSFRRNLRAQPSLAHALVAADPYVRRRNQRKVSIGALCALDVETARDFAAERRDVASELAEATRAAAVLTGA